MPITKKKYKYLLKDEAMATKEYKHLSTKGHKRLFNEMSRDEHKHHGYIQRMMCEGEGGKFRKGRCVMKGKRK